MNKNRANLRKQITQRLLPELRKLGFEGPTSIDGNQLLHEFRRSRAGGTDVLTIQLEKRGLPRFLVTLYVEPSEGMEAVSAKGSTVIVGSVKPRRGSSTRSWFRADPTFWQRLLGSSHTREIAATEACIALLPEIESWWAVQQSTNHITAWPVTYAAKPRD